MAAGSPTTVLIETDLTNVMTVSAGDPAAEFASKSTSMQRLARRPMRGIQIKKETFATLSVTDAALKIKNSSASPNAPAHFTSNFLLQGVSESRQEKFQPVPTFGATYGYFFGEQPRIVSFSALLLNTADFQWEAEWWANYDQYLRGTRLVDRGIRVSMAYEDVVLEGYIINASVAKSEPNPWAASLSFSMWVVQVHYLIDIGEGKISSVHTANADTPTEWDEFDGDTAGAPTMLEEVRARNVASLAAGPGSGLLGAISKAMNEVQGFTGDVGNAVGNAMDWLYGRNMVIPAGFAGSERTSGQATFADGSGTVLLPNGETGGSVTIRAPIRMAAVTQAKGNFFDDNVDEYPARYNAGVQVYDLYVTEPTDPAIAFAESMFRQFGINVSNDTGQSTSEVMRALGRSTFAALSYVATGASAQDAAALAATATSADFLTASAEQAVAEAMFR